MIRTTPSQSNDRRIAGYDNSWGGVAQPASVVPVPVCLVQPQFTVNAPKQGLRFTWR